MPLPPVNHNSRWRVVTAKGIRRVYACDEVQAAEWVRQVFGLAVLRVVLDGRAQDTD